MMADVYDPATPQAVQSSPPTTGGGIMDFLSNLGQGAGSLLSGVLGVAGSLPTPLAGLFAMPRAFSNVLGMQGANLQMADDRARFIHSMLASDPRYLAAIMSGANPAAGGASFMHGGAPFSIFPTTAGGPGANIPEPVQELLLNQMVPSRDPNSPYQYYRNLLSGAHVSGAVPQGVPVPTMYPDLAQSWAHQAQALALQQNPFLFAGGTPGGLPMTGWSYDPKTGAFRFQGGIPPPPVQTDRPYVPPPPPTGETPGELGSRQGGGGGEGGRAGLPANETPPAGGRGLGRGLSGQTYTWQENGQPVTGTVDTDGMRIPRASNGRPYIMALDANGQPIAIDAGAAKGGNLPANPAPATPAGQGNQGGAGGGNQGAGGAGTVEAAPTPPTPPAATGLDADEQQLERLRPEGQTGNPSPAFQSPGDIAGEAVGRALGAPGATPPAGRLQTAVSSLVGPASAEAAGMPAEPKMVTKPGETIQGGQQVTPSPGQREGMVGSQEKPPPKVSELRANIGDAINTYPWLRTALQNKYKTNNINSIDDATLEHDDLAIAAGMTIKLQRQLDLANAKAQQPAPAELAQSRQAAATKQVLQQMLITPVGKNAAGEDVIPLDASPKTANPFVTIGQTGELLSAHGGVPGWLGALLQLGGPGGPGVPGAPPGMWSVVQMANSGGVMGLAASKLLQGAMLAINMAKALGASGRINQRELDILMNVAIPSPSSTYQRNIVKFQGLMMVLDDVINEVSNAQLHSHIDQLGGGLNEAIPRQRSLVGQQGTAISGTIGREPAKPPRTLGGR